MHFSRVTLNVSACLALYNSFLYYDIPSEKDLLQKQRSDISQGARKHRSNIIGQDNLTSTRAEYNARLLAAGDQIRDLNWNLGLLNRTSALLKTTTPPSGQATKNHYSSCPEGKSHPTFIQKNNGRAEVFRTGPSYPIYEIQEFQRNQYKSSKIHTKFPLLFRTLGMLD